MSRHIARMLIFFVRRRGHDSEDHGHHESHQVNHCAAKLSLGEEPEQCAVEDDHQSAKQDRHHEERPDPQALSWRKIYAVGRRRSPAKERDVHADGHTGEAHQYQNPEHLSLP